jgi:error-prone DNA polymerase
MPLAEHVVADYQTTRLSLKAHPMSFLRDRFRAERVLSCAEADGDARCRLRQGGGRRPGAPAAGQGKCHLHDHRGRDRNLQRPDLWARNFKRFRREVMSARLALVEGRVQRSEEGVVHVMASRLHDRTAESGPAFAGTRGQATNSPAPTNC